MVDVTLDMYELKSSIMQKLGIRAITPGDCKRISMEISKSLKKNVSETTIKRLFGFAETKHQFSRFTLTTLLEYVEQADNLQLVKPEFADLNTKELNGNRDQLHNKSLTITSCTLKRIRNRSGLPYEMTINRKFAENDFNEFFKSNYRFTCFIAQPGYGKTTLLSHLIETSFYSENPAFEGSSVLFLNIGNLINEDQSFDIEDALKEQMKIPVKQSFTNLVDRYYSGDHKKFIIVLDGFCEVFLKRERRNQLFDSIINFICELEDFDAIKVVMSMRSTTWIRFHERMRHSSYLKSVWYQGSHFDSNDISNVPTLTTKEVDQIIAKMNMSNVGEINPKLKAQLKFPFHIQLYYQLNEEDPNFNYASNLPIYEMISKFIQEKIYRSNYFTEKILFLKKIIQLTDYGKRGSFVSKSHLIGELSVFKNAYMELLVDGILMEERTSEDSHPQEFVRFVHPHVFEYFLFIEILEKFDLNVSIGIFNFIKTEYEGNHMYFILLQWAIRFVVKTGSFDTFNYIFNLGLYNYEKNYLILFFAENLKHRLNTQPNTADLIKQHQIHDLITKQLLVFDFIDSCYKEAISVLIEVSNSDEQRLTYHSILAIPDLLSLDKDKIKSRINQLAELQDPGENWIINTNVVIGMVYKKIIDHHISSKEIELVMQQIMSPHSNVKDFGTKEATSYILAFAFNLFFGDQKKVILLIEDIRRQLPKLFYKRTSFSVYLLNILGMAGARTNPGRQTDQIERIISKVSENKNRYSFTEYSDSLFRLFKAEQSKNRKEYAKAISLAEECLDIFKRNHLNANTLLVYNLLIGIYTDLNDTGKLNEIKQDKRCFMDDRNLPLHLFESPKMLKL
jgi:hypothetical protein